MEAEKAVDKLEKILPRQMFSLKIQGRALGRIISSRSMSGMKKDVTQHMYGGDITRKMKLREKQKKGKKKMKERGKVNIPQDVFLKMMRSGVKQYHTDYDNCGKHCPRELNSFSVFFVEKHMW